MSKPFFARHALLVLAIVFFFVPFAMRGSRYAVQRMKNDVKDWLPADFPETAELDWFRKRFLGEQFVVVSWDGCRGTADDEQFRVFVDNLFPELPPSQRGQLAREEVRPDFTEEDPLLYIRELTASDSKQVDQFIGNKLSLRASEDQHLNWGQRQEKWLRSGQNNWVYITPKGDLYQWKGNQSWPAQLGRWLSRSISGKESVKGEFVASLGVQDGPWYYEDPTRLNAHLFKSVMTGPSVLNQLLKLKIDRNEAHDRLRGVFFGPNDEQTCIVITLTDAGKADPRSVVGRGMLGKEPGELLKVAEASGLQAPRPPPALPGFLSSLTGAPVDIALSSKPLVRMGGPPVDNAAIDEEGQITLVRLLGLSLAVGLGLSWVCFRSIKITLMVFLVGGISAVTSVGVVYWTGSQLDAVLMSMPSLVYVLGISGAVHVVNYYRESVTESGLSTAPDRSVRLGLRPCMMAALTTSLGLISLATSNIVPIKKFGCYAAIGVIATLLLLFTFLPAALEMWPPRRYLKRSEKSGESDSPASAVERFLDRFWQGVAHVVIRHYRLVAVACAVALVLGAFGLTRIRTDVQLLKLFDHQAKIIEDYEWLEAHLGKLVPMEIVIRVHPDLIDPSDVSLDLEDAVNNPEALEAKQTLLGMDFHERMLIAERVASEINTAFGEPGAKFLSQPMRASTFVPPPPKNVVFADQFRTAYARQLEMSRDSLVESGFLRDDPADDHELWRISLRLAALDGIDFGTFVKDVQRVVEPIMVAYEYRETILKRLAQNKSEANSVPRVHFVGWEPDPNVADEGDPQVTIDQTRIFVTYLIKLLDAEGIKSGINIEPQTISEVNPSDTIIVLKDVPGVSAQALNQTQALRFDASNIEFDPGSDATAKQSFRRISAVYTGLVPIVYKAQRTLLASLIESTGLAFVMIAGVMIILLRSPKAGLLSMFPNVFPVVMIFGFMGWQRISVDIGSMMTASVAMGVAVDDTIHFLSWFRKSLDAGETRKQAILTAYRRVATAMTQTTAIGGIGLSIFAFSTFTPTQRFGALMLALLVAALVGDLLFLPALLASSLGRVFDRRRDVNSVETESTGSTLSGPRTTDRDDESVTLPQGMRRDDSHRT